MTFYDRYELLCNEHGVKAQNQEIMSVTGVTSGSISGWKKGAMPKVEIICRLAKHFNVSSDYLLGLSELRNPVPTITISEEERLLLEAYHTATVEGKFNIIQVCMNEKGKRDAVLVG